MINKKKLYETGLRFCPKTKNDGEKQLFELVLKFGSVSKGNFLDAGIGIGKFISFVHKAFPKWSCYGIDVVPDFVNHRHAGIKLSLQSAEKMSFKTGFFSVVTCIDALHHVPDREKALKEISRVTKKNGLVLFRDIRPKNGFDKLYYRIVDLGCLAYNHNLPKYFEMHEWPMVLKKCGLKILHIQKFDSELDWIVCQKK